MTLVPAFPGIPRQGLAHVVGPTDQPLRDQTMTAMLQAAVARAPGHEALVFADTGCRLTYADLAREVDDLAAGFLALGLGAGDRIGIWSPNRLEWVLTMFAAARVGAILVNVNPAYRPSELDFALRKTGCRAIVAASRFKSSDYAGMLRDLMPELARGERPSRFPDLAHVIVTDEAATPGMIAFADVAGRAAPEDRARLDAPSAAAWADDAVNIQFTSGTTGQPKGVTLTHRNIVNNAVFVTDRIALTAADRLAIPVPLYHCFGMVMGVLGAVDKGATMIFPGEGFEAARCLDVIAAERATALYGVPTMFVAMLHELGERPRDLSRLRTGIMAGASCPIEIMRRVNAEMHMDQVTICYGMTETAPVSFQSMTDDPTERRCATVGRVHPHLEVKLVDPAGDTVPVGRTGEVWTRGYSVMRGYWDDPAATDAAVRDGWMRTGDLGVMDADGFLSITGRVKDMIIRGGENISPREIEEFLIGLPGVRDVQVFGIPDDTYGEEVCAWVVPRPGAELTPEGVRDLCRGRIAHYKVPRHVRIVDDLPMTVTGKPQKFIMRQEMRRLLGS